MLVAIYPGTFDPITHGHIDIAVRASKIFNKVIAVVANNPGKKDRFFNDKERLSMVRDSFKGIPGIEVHSYEGLIVDCLRDFGATAIIRGMRALSDFDYEFQMAFTNRNMSESAETIFLMPSAEYIYLNSTMVKDIARLGGDVSQFVPLPVQKMLHKKFGPISRSAR